MSHFVGKSHTGYTGLAHKSRLVAPLARLCMLIRASQATFMTDELVQQAPRGTGRHGRHHRMRSNGARRQQPEDGYRPHRACVVRVRLPSARQRNVGGAERLDRRCRRAECLGRRAFSGAWLAHEPNRSLDEHRRSRGCHRRSRHLVRPMVQAPPVNAAGPSSEKPFIWNRHSLLCWLWP